MEGSDGGWNEEVFADDGLQLKTEKEANCSILIALFEKLQNETLGTRLSGPLILHMERRGLFTFFLYKSIVVVVFLTILLFMSFRLDFVIQLFFCSLTFAFLSILFFQFLFFD